jgi:hypothetical protein
VEAIYNPQPAIWVLWELRNIFSELSLILSALATKNT